MMPESTSTVRPSPRHLALASICGRRPRTVGTVGPSPMGEESGTTARPPSVASPRMTDNWNCSMSERLEEDLTMENVHEGAGGAFVCSSCAKGSERYDGERCLAGHRGKDV